MYKSNGDQPIDGDQETLAAVKNAKYHKLFMPMCPTYTFIDRADGKFNRAMDFKKDYSAIISAAWEIDRTFDAYLSDPDQDSYEILEKAGLYSATTDADAAAQRMEFLERLVKANSDNPLKGRFIDDTMSSALGEGRPVGGAASINAQLNRYYTFRPAAIE